MNTPEWITRSASLLLPAAGPMRRMALEPVGVAPHASPRTAFAASSQVPTEPKHAVTPDVSVPVEAAAATHERFTQQRLAAMLRRGDEALSPRLLRRVLGELQAVLDPQVSEVEGGRRAQDFARWYGAATPAQQRDCWLLMSEQFAPDSKLVQAARGQYDAAQHTPGAGQAEIGLRRALLSPRATLLQRFAAFPDGLGFLVRLRSKLLPHLKTEPRLLALDAELLGLFSTWFDVAFLELRRISWDSPASLVEKLIDYEAVHDIHGWSDLKNRLDSDRRCYGFFHPQLPNEPLIFVEVALLDELPATIAPLLDEAAAAADLDKASTAVFYSISSTQGGLHGVSFGDSLIKRVVETLKGEFPRLKTFATLSPMPGFRTWLGQHAQAMLDRLDDKTRAALAATLGGTPVSAAQLLAGAEQALTLDQKSPLRLLLLRCAAHYLGVAVRGDKPLDPVARFHLGNGARIERINWGGDRSAKGLRQSYGMMVNYLYDLQRLDKYRAQFSKGKTALSSAVSALRL